MPTIRTIKRRIRSVRNTMQMTRAMEAVAANKMRRAQLVALAARPYAEKALEILANVEPEAIASLHPLLKKYEKGKVLIVLITSDKGLCGALNAGILQRLVKLLDEIELIQFHEVRLPKEVGLQQIEIEFIALGQYGAKWLKKQGYTVIESRKGIGEIARLEEARPIAEKVMLLYQTGIYKEVLVMYANFLSVLRQEPLVHRILPIVSQTIWEIAEGIGGMKKIENREIENREVDKWRWEYKFEPSRLEILSELLPALVEIAIYHMILEANASEHSARMVAMKNASDNAEDILKDLTLNYNKARQAMITKELTEITAGKEALAEISN